MTQTLKTLTRTTDTLKGIRSIVHTMKTLSAINALPYEQAARSIDAYRDTVLDGFQAFLHSNRALALTSQEKAVQVIIAFGSDHGLCGSYNEIMAEEVSRQLQRHAPSDSVVRVLCVGAQMEDALVALGVQIENTLLPPATVDGLGRLAGDMVTCLDDIRRESISVDVAVTLVFTERAAHGQQTPVTQQLLPLDAELIEDLTHRAWISRSLPVFNLPPDDLLAELICGYLFASMFRAAAEALVTENAARLARMQQAEQSIDERLEIQKSETRLARQNEITTELLDVIIGFEALKDRDQKRKKHRPATDLPAG